MQLSNNKRRLIETSSPENDNITAMVQASNTVAESEGESVSGACIDGRIIIKKKKLN